MSQHNFYPEMGGTAKPNTLEARWGYDAVYITTPRTLKKMRGMKLVEVLDRATLVPQAAHKHGWNKYKLTANALEKLRETEEISMEIHL